jgi:hypothetical protein
MLEIFKDVDPWEVIMSYFDGYDEGDALLDNKINELVVIIKIDDKHHLKMGEIYGWIEGKRLLKVIFTIPTDEYHLEKDFPPTKNLVIKELVTQLKIIKPNLDVNIVHHHDGLTSINLGVPEINSLLLYLYRHLPALFHHLQIDKFTTKSIFSVKQLTDFILSDLSIQKVINIYTWRWYDIPLPNKHFCLSLNKGDDDLFEVQVEFNDDGKKIRFDNYVPIEERAEAIDLEQLLQHFLQKYGTLTSMLPTVLTMTSDFIHSEEGQLLAAETSWYYDYMDSSVNMSFKISSKSLSTLLQKYLPLSKWQLVADNHETKITMKIKELGEMLENNK